MTHPAGRINKLFGTDGGVMLSLYAAFPDDFDAATTPLLVTIDALEVPLWCDRFERHGQTGALATFADMDTERRAKELLGLEFRVEQSASSDDEFYLEDLIGFAVEVREGAGPTMRGRLADYYDSDVNPLFELDIEGRRVLVPAVGEFIGHIDFEVRTIELAVPDGLLSLESE